MLFRAAMINQLVHQMKMYLPTVLNINLFIFLNLIFSVLYKYKLNIFSFWLVVCEDVTWNTVSFFFFLFSLLWFYIYMAYCLKWIFFLARSFVLSQNMLPYLCLGNLLVWGWYWSLPNKDIGLAHVEPRLTFWVGCITTRQQHTLLVSLCRVRVCFIVITA